MMYIVTQLVCKKDKVVLKEIFAVLDRDADGRLSKGDLKEAFDSEKSAEAVVSAFDSTDGCISYSGTVGCMGDSVEYLVGAIDKNSALTRKNIQLAFELFAGVRWQRILVGDKGVHRGGRRAAGSGGKQQWTAG